MRVHKVNPHLVPENHKDKNRGQKKKKQTDARPAAACFDFDGTLVVTRSGGPFARNAEDWRWISPTVPETLNELALVRGYRLVIFTNQRSKFKEATVLAAVKELKVAVDVHIAFDPKCKKPSKAMYEEAFEFRTHPEGSFYVGDALGRPGDWSDVDLKFAEACGLPVRSPEEFFGLRSKSAATYTTYTKDRN